MEKENINHKIYHEGCLYNNSKPECKACDGFGKDLDKDTEVKKCYTTKEQIEENLGLKKYL
jgi:hypothetical protein